MSASMQPFNDKEPILLQNALHIPEDDVYLNSVHVHDYVTHKLRDGAEASVDGGLDYIRRGWSTGLRESGRLVEWSLYDNSPIQEVRQKLLWGTRGKLGDQPLRYQPIATFERDHLAAILANVPRINPLHREVIKYWLDILDGAGGPPRKRPQAKARKTP